MKRMLYRSTNRKSDFVTFREALLRGQAPDYGLYVPIRIPKLSKKEINSFRNKSYNKIAFLVMNKFLKDEIRPNHLKKLIKDAYNFDVPIEKVDKCTFLMRLDKGPTASFKDFAARLMARLMHYFIEKENKKVTVLVSTSGDTGGAVADAFHGLKNINVVVLFPKAGVSSIQRKQMTTLNKNIRALAVNGNFDDCQALVKQAFNDKDLGSLNLTSANSINFGRLLPQTVYYFFAYSRVGKDKIIFSVPSGNFGNLMGGVVAREMGLPVEKFIVAVNENDEFPVFLKNGNYRPVEPARKSSSSAMNIGHPSNLARLVDLYGGWLYDKRDKKGKVMQKGILRKKPNLKKLNEDFASFSISDNEVDNTIREFYFAKGKLLEPHGAVGWCALQKFIKNRDKNKKVRYVSIETADPAKFPEHAKRIFGTEPKLPQKLSKLKIRGEKFEAMENDYGEFKKMLLGIKN